MEAWQTVLWAIGGSTALHVVLAFLGKSFVEKILARDSKRFEMELKNKFDVATEHLKSELQRQTINYQVRFAGFHQKRAEVIAELYSLIDDFHSEVQRFNNPYVIGYESDDRKETHKVVSCKAVKTYQFFNKHRIYLPEQLCHSLEEFIEKLSSYVIDAAAYLQVSGYSEAREQKFNQNWEAIKREVPLARQKLEDEFRHILDPAREIEPL